MSSINIQPIEQPAPSPAAAPRKRAYVAPRLVVHGDVSALTLGKTGSLPDVESAGSHNVGLM